MAVLAWRMVSFVLSRMNVEFSPTDHSVSEDDWKQFMEFLCGSYLNYALLSENRTSWTKVVAGIDDLIANQNVAIASEPLPMIDWSA